MSLDGDDLGLAPGYTVVYDLTPSAPFLTPAIEKVRPFAEEKIALVFRVPYWLITSRPRPSWRERPLWRLRALAWRWQA